LARRLPSGCAGATPDRHCCYCYLAILLRRCYVVLLVVERHSREQLHELEHCRQACTSRCLESRCALFAARQPQGQRADPAWAEYHISRFPYSIPIQTRWNDNDVYGHVNNIIYYSFFDTVVNKFLITRGGLDIVKSPVIGLVVHSECEYFRELSYPEIITAGRCFTHTTARCLGSLDDNHGDDDCVGLRVGRLGERSVEYEVGIFKEHRHHKHHHHHGAQHHHQHHHQRGQSEEQAEEIEMRLAAFGKFVHVFVNRETRAAVAIPESLRPELEKLVVKSA